MCGLYLSVGLEPDRSALMRAAHRGPDGVGWRVFDTPAGPLAMGHLRLAIIDPLPRSEQPMADDELRFWLTLNGEIYNYRELRTELALEGVQFHTSSDSEVALQAWRRWGPAALDRFLGMFALFVWDDQEKVLHAARDRFGIKPVYFAETARGIAFASEPKQLIGLEGVSHAMNIARIHNFLQSGISDHTAETMFAGMRQLRPGQLIRLKLDCWRPGSAVEPVTWWSPRADSLADISEDEAADRFRELFLDSVQLHLRSDVRLGSCLSGGLDSSSIVGAMAKLLGSGSGIDTFSATFEEKEADERSFMRAANEFSGCTPHYINPTPARLLQDLEALVHQQDEPFGSTSIFAQWCVFAAAKEEGVRVMLDGQGADEQLAGYHGAFIYHLRALIRSGDWAGAARTVFERKTYNGVSVFEQIDPYLQSRLPFGIRKHLIPTTPPPEPPWLTGPAANAAAPPEGSAFAQAIAADGMQSVDTIGDLCRAMITTNLPMLLRYEDRNSMAHSVEARVPFVDHRLVEFSLGLEDRHKIVGGETKRILRRALGDLLPKSIRQRRDKLGFATPESAWFRGPLRETVSRMIDVTLDLYPQLFDAEATRRLRDEMLEGRRPFDFSLWRIANVGMWGGRFGVRL